MRSKVSPVVFKNSKMERLEVKDINDPDYFKKHYSNNSVDHITVTNLISDPAKPIWKWDESMRLLSDIFSVLRVGGTLTVSEDMQYIINEFLKMRPRYRLSQPIFIGKGSEFMRFYVFHLEDRFLL